MVGDRMELSNNDHSGKTRGPPLLLAKRYIRSQISAQKHVPEGQTCPNRPILCKGRRLKRLGKVYNGEGSTKEYPTSPTFEYESDPGWDERSENRKKMRSFKDLHASTDIIVLD